MATTRGTFSRRRSRRTAERQAEIVEQRMRRLGLKTHEEDMQPVEPVRPATHTERWCPETNLNILLGPDGRCPACGSDSGVVLA